MIYYYSTSGKAEKVSFAEALFQGLAPDGGLYFPDQMPTFSAEELDQLKGASLQEVGFQVLQKWFGAEIPEEALRPLAYAAQNFPIELNEVGPFQMLEMFHGPTMAFKDVAAQNLSRLMSHFLSEMNQEITLLVATSGDTGGAIAHGFADVPHIKVYVLFPKGRVSGLQEEQLTRTAANVHPIEIDGYFDDCQAMVKQAFTDPDLAGLSLTSANSISIGRLIPQIIYYVYSYAVLQRDDLEFVVPSGNFGNITAGLFAQAMGIPIKNFIAATNENDVAVRYQDTAVYEPHKTVATLSNAMDVGNPSNFIRVLELFGHDYETFRDKIQAYKVSDEETVATMKRVYEEHGYQLDPHTAVGWLIAERHGQDGTIVVSTASPIKFAEEITRTTGLSVADDEAIAALQTRPKRKTVLPNDYDTFKAHLLANA